MRKGTVIKTGIGFICGAILLVSVYHFVKPPDHFETTVPAWRLRLEGIHSALCRYKQEFGNYPAGDERRISLAVAGDNPLNRRFLFDWYFSKTGDLADPWDTPVRITFPKDGTCVVKSAGKNKKWGDADDHEYSMVSEVQLKLFPPRSLTTESQYR